MSRDDKYKAVYAPNFEPDENDGSTLVLKSGAQPATAEYLTCEGKKPINISFKRDYARIRIYTGGIKDSYSLTINKDKFTTNDGKDTPSSFTLTPDKNGNSFIYGTWSEETSIKADLDVSFQSSDYLYVNATGGNFTTKAASTANRSYSIDVTYVTLDLSKATAAVTDWSSFTGNGITKVKMIGEWNDSYQHKFSGNTKITSIDLSKATGMEVVSVPTGFCDGCTGLIEVKLPDNLKSIPSQAFYRCSALTAINIPEGVTSIGYGAFRNCSSLDNIKIPNNVTSIASFTFDFCYKLSTIEIPEGLTNIYTRAFGYCKSLSKVICRATTPPTLDTLPFYESSNSKTLYVPDEAVSDYKADTNWSAAFGDDIKPISDLPAE
jgi:hypothetical protein